MRNEWKVFCIFESTNKNDMTTLNSTFNNLMESKPVRLTSEELDTLIFDFHNEATLQGFGSTKSYLKSECNSYGCVVIDVIAPRLRRIGKTNVPDITWATFIEK
tara:strand:- start:374 stop:685 length:312 start_codon:yes stop_codon:yes gene_type:complete